MTPRRSKNEHTKLLTVRLPHDLHANLQRAADERVVGVRLLVEHALRSYLARLPKVDDEL